MGAARHFNQPGEIPTQQLRPDIEADIATARRAQQEFQDAGQHRLAADMGKAVDEYLDELRDVRGR